jgi:hypothetical protein
VLPQVTPPAQADELHSRPPESLRFAVALVVVLVAGILVRLPFLPRLGHAYDQGEYIAWLAAIQDHGLARVYEHSNADYVGYQYILWAIGKAYGGRAAEATVRDKDLRVWLKLPGLAGDLLTTSLIAIVAAALARGREANLGPRLRRIAGRLQLSAAQVAGLAAGALYLFHPAVLYAGSYWGQQDSLVIFFMLLACWLGWNRLPGWAGAMLALGIMVKPQPLLLGPLLAWIVWRQTSWPGLARGALVGGAVLAAGHVHFVLAGHTDRLWEIYTLQIQQTEHMSFGAYNLWWPADLLAGVRPDTTLLAIGSIAISAGAVALLLVMTVLGIAWYCARGNDAVQILIAVGVWLAGYSVVAAGSHERYALLALAFFLPALPVQHRLRWALLLYTVATFANLLIALPLDRRWDQGDPTWLTIVVSGAMVIAALGLGWVALRVRSGPTLSGPTPNPLPERKGRI